MEDTRITFETAKLAKEKGFEFRVVWGYILGFKDDSERDKYLPTQSLLSKWLREKHNIDINIITKHKDLGKFYGGFIDTNNKINKSIGSNYKTYEEALEAGLQEALKLIK